MCGLLIVHYFLVRLAVIILQLCLQLDVLLVFLVELDYEILSLNFFRVIYVIH